MLIEEMTTLSYNVCQKEPEAALKWLALPKDERIREQDHSNRRPEMTKFVYWMVV